MIELGRYMGTLEYGLSLVYTTAYTSMFFGLGLTYSCILVGCIGDLGLRSQPVKCSSTEQYVCWTGRYLIAGGQSL